MLNFLAQKKCNIVAKGAVLHPFQNYFDKFFKFFFPLKRKPAKGLSELQ